MDINNSKRINLDFNTLLILYKHYKNYVLPLGIILVSILVFYFIVIPEIQQYFVSRNQLETESGKLDILKNNYNFLANLDDSKLDKDLKSLSLVLPSMKDFAGVLNAISIASSKTGISIGEFEFSLGDLAKPAEGEINPALKININVVGTPEAIVKFINELYKTAPLSDIISIKSAADSSTLTLIFYYKPFLSQRVNDETPITPFSSKTLSLIKDISAWNNVSEQPILTFIPSLDSSSSGTFISSSSAGSNPSPF